MSISRPRLVAPLVASLAALFLVLLPAGGVPVAQAAGAADAQASEVVRLINGERGYLGKPPLRLDRFLAAKARDGAIWCPDDPSLVMAGRAKDIALSGSMVHPLRLCPQYSVLDAMKMWGYKGARGEILAVNGGYGTGSVTYTYGCSPSVSTCPGSSTSTSNTVAHAMSGWMRSSGHYSIVVGAYDRVGCGAWIGPTGAFYYACLFSMGGSPTATPKPARPRTSGAAPAASAAASPSPTQAPPWPTPSGASWSIPWSGSAASPGPVAGGLGPAAFDSGLKSETDLSLAARVALLAGGLAGGVALSLPLLLALRRRRSHGGRTGPG